MQRALSVFIAAMFVACAATLARPAAGTPTSSVLPGGWPAVLQLGMSSAPGDAARMRGTAGFGLRSQYLAGGVNSGGGWSTWNPDGAFVTSYAQESRDQGMRSVFDYYMILQSRPANGSDEASKAYSNLNDAGTMSVYYADLRLFFQRAAPFDAGAVVLHVEPDLWGYLEQRSIGDDARTVSAQVSGSGVADVAGLPDTAAGFAQAIAQLRDRYAPGVVLAYHLSVWGTHNDILYSKPDDATIDGLAARAATFYTTLGSSFDLTFTDASDRDAAFKQYIYGDHGSWWSAADYTRNARFLGRFAAITSTRIVVWQVPIGNTKMRAMNNSWHHYQDNHVEWFLDDPTRAHLREYANAGVIGIIFGRGADGATCACDAAGDGVTDPAPIGGNTRISLNADDDGGFFRALATAYYAAGPLALDTAGSPSPSPRADSSPTPPGPCMPSEGPGIAPSPRVDGGTRGRHAAWYGQSGYPTLCPGQRSTATVAFYNSGSVGRVRGRIGEVAYLGI